MSPESRRRFSSLAAMAVVVVAAACDVTEPGESPFGSVITLVDSGTSLKSARTFALPDTIVEVGNSAFSIDHSHDSEVIARVREHFVALGWTEVSGEGATPDVLVLNAAATRIETGVAYGGWYDAWGYLPYWGTMDGSWWWGMPAGAVTYSFPAGTLITVMVDLRAPRESDKQIPVLWASAIDGVVNGSATVSRVLAGVDQAFEQSPYLRVQ